MTDEKIRNMKTGFRLAVDANRAVDDAVDALYQQLLADGRLAQTVFFFISDNSVAAGEHRYNSKGCEYEECNKVPYIVVCPPAICPSAAPGTLDGQHMVLNIDIAPTLADMAGVTIPTLVDGTSLSPVLNDPSTAWRSSFIIEDKWPAIGLLDGIVIDYGDGHTYKYVDLLQDSEVEMFDLTNDPWELSNIANDGIHSDIQSSLTDLLHDAITSPIVMLTYGPPQAINQTTVSFEWSSDQPSTFQCTLDSAPYEPCGSGTVGSSTYTELPEATHTFTLQATDPDNNMSAISSTFIVDLTPPPTPSLTSVPPDPSNTSPSFSFTDDESGVSFVCTLDSLSPESCTSPKTYSGLSGGTHTFTVYAVDAATNQSPAASDTWSVSADSTPPTVTMGKPSVDALLTTNSVTASWTGTDNTGIVRYELYERIGTTGAQALVQSSLKKSFTRIGQSATTYCYQVLAYDVAGNVGVGQERCAGIPYDDRNEAITYTGAVTQVSAPSGYSGTLTVMDGAGQQAQFTFTGRRIGVLCRKDAASGKVQVWIDGTLKKTVDLYSSTTRDKLYIFNTALTQGVHSLALVWTGTKNRASSGTAISLDGIGIIG
jgi:hypothetical protein